MAKLILSMDGLVLKEIPLTQERTTIGRRASNDIVIDNLAISGEHAVILTILNDSFLEDLGSTNGTLVNGQPIKKHFLQPNDVIELGKYKIKFIVESKGQAHFEGLAEAKPDQVASSAPVTAAPAGQAVIQILNGPNAGRELALTKPLTTLGRPGVQVAAITRRPEGFFLSHVEGAHMPNINGSDLAANEHLLESHDVFELSGTRMEFLIK